MTRLLVMARLLPAGAMLAAMLTAAALPRAGMAATPEDAYFAARDAAIARIKAIRDANKRGPTEPDDNKVYDEDTRARAELEAKMRAIVGPVSIKGMTGDGTFNVDTLIEGDEGFGLLDGMVYGPVDGTTRVIVTTESLFRHWLREHKDWWGKDSGDIPQEMSEAVKSDGFYTQATLTDAAIMRFADLPVHKPAQARFVFAMLAARSQDRAPAKANEIFVAVAEGGRIYIGNTTESGPIGPIAACDTIRRDLERQASAVWQDNGNSALSKEELQKKADALSGKSESEFLRCFAKRAARTQGFTAAAQAAQALIARLPN